MANSDSLPNSDVCQKKNKEDPVLMGLYMMLEVLQNWCIWGTAGALITLLRTMRSLKCMNYFFTEFFI